MKTAVPRPGSCMPTAQPLSAQPRKSSIGRNCQCAKMLTGIDMEQCFVMQAIGRRHWAIAEGWIPSKSSFSDHALISHETACILNTGDKEAHVTITVFFANREPAGPFRVTVAARRTLHLRFNDLKDPAPTPRDTDYSSVFESDVPVIVQHTRLDSRHAEIALMSTTAYSER